MTIKTENRPEPARSKIVTTVDIELDNQIVVTTISTQLTDGVPLGATEISSSITRGGGVKADLRHTDLPEIISALSEHVMQIDPALTSVGRKHVTVRDEDGIRALNELPRGSVVQGHDGFFHFALGKGLFLLVVERNLGAGGSAGSIELPARILFVNKASA